MEGCQEARGAIAIVETACPKCKKELELFIKDGRTAADAQCGRCGWFLRAGTPEDQLKW